MEENIFLQSVFPILQYENTKISVAGTSIFVEHRGLPFMVTAAHVIRNNGKKYPLYISLEDEVVDLIGKVWLTSDKLDNNDLDIAIIDLDSNQRLMNSLNGYKTISLDEATTIYAYNNQYFFIFGFPWRKSSYKRSEKIIISKPLPYITNIENRDKIYDKYRRPKENHIIVRYTRKNTFNQDRKKIWAPLPYGISGGPLFSVLVNQADIVSSPFVLEGVLSEWRGNEFIIATRKSLLRQVIDDVLRYPAPSNLIVRDIIGLN